MATTIFPTANDVAATTGAGDTLTEASLAAWIKALLGQNFVVSGFTLPASDADLVMPVALGEAMIDGYRVVIDAATDVTCTANNTNHIFLKLAHDGAGNMTGASFEVNTTGTAPDHSTKIGTAVADASSITSTTDARVLPPWHATGGHTHNATTGNGPKLNSVNAIEFTAPPTLKTGYQETGYCGAGFYASGATQDGYGGVNFKTVMTNVPSSVTLTPGSSGNMAGGFPQVTNITKYGLMLKIESAGSGLCYAVQYSYTTVDN